MEDLHLDDDDWRTIDTQDHEDMPETIDRGGQFHLQSAILPVNAMLPSRTLSKYQEKMINHIKSEAECESAEYDQISVFKDYIGYVEQSYPLQLSEDIKMMAMTIISSECEIFAELFQEPEMRSCVRRVVDRSMLSSSYTYHIKYLQKAVYVYNYLLSKRLGDEDMKLSYIRNITSGRGYINSDNTVVIYSYDDDRWMIYITRELIGWKHDGLLRITTPAILLNLCDKVQERFNIQMITEIGSKVSPLIYPTWQDTKKIIAWGDKVIDELGNDGYGLLGNLESIMISRIIKSEDDGFDQGRFQDNIIQDILEDGIYFDPYIRELLQLIQDKSHYHIAQLHGLYRAWGHPEVDSLAGMKKVGDLLHQKKNVDRQLEIDCNMTFREVFFVNYYQKHGFYPPYSSLKYDEIKDAKIRKAHVYIVSKLESCQEIDILSPYYNRCGWSYITITKCFPLPTGLNIASFLKDRAVSPSRTDLIHMVVNNGRVTDPFKRRGVLMWLANQPIDIPGLLKDINERATGLPDDDCTIGLYPKERELKLQARMFALMSYKMRVYFVTTEEMLSHHVLPYFPQIAMNDNFLQIQQKFVSLTTPMAKDHDTHVTYIVNIDFKKWNQQMRRDITIGVFTDLGRMFGLPELYNRTYDIFKNSYVYLCNGTYLPRVINGKLKAQYPLSWEGDQGGKEGLRQKGWTIVSAMDLYNICKEHSLTFKIIGGGDNQVLIITMPKGPNGLAGTHNRMERFLSDLDEKMKKRGLPLKIGETWVSSSLFAYNKYMIFKGVQLPSTLKLASRCFHLSNTDLMTIENMFGTLAVSYQSIISKDHSCLVGWIFSRLNAAYYLKALWEHHPFLGQSISEILTDQVQLSGLSHKTTFKNQLTLYRLYYMILLFPRVLGGAGTLNMFSYLSRGFPDNLSEWLSYLYLMRKHSPGDVKYVIEQILCPTKRSMPKYSKLLEDPCSLSLDSAEIGSGALRNIAERYLAESDKIENKGFKEFLQLSSKDDVEKMADTLCSNVTIIPRELHDIMGSTIYGYMNSIIAKIDKSTTINKLGSGVNVIEKIRATEKNWINYCGYRLTVQFGMKALKCPTRTAEAWRNESWEKKIIGVTTPHPSAFLRASYGKFHNNCDGNFLLHVNLFRKHVDLPYKGSGPCKPYLGSYTREKSLGTELASAYGSEPLVRRPIHLQKLIAWRYKEDGCMSRIIKACLRSVTDLPNEFLISDPRCVTGDAEHRYRDKATKHEGVINNLYYWSTWCRTLTDSFMKHSRGGKNETIQFQTCLLYIHALSSMVNDGCHGALHYFSRLKTKQIGEVHYHEICDECIVPLIDPGEHETAPKYFPPIPTCPNNPYLYVRREDMEFTYAELVEISEYEKTILTDSIEHTYDLRTALSLLLGCRIGRALTGSRHNEENLTESTIRLMLGKVHFPTLMSGIINYITAWKFMKKMITNNEDENYNQVMITEVTERSGYFETVFDMLTTYHHQRSAMQSWCRANDTGIALGDIEATHVVYEVLKRAQLNSQRIAMKIYKTRGESVNRQEKVIRTLMGMDYIASSCTECQNLVRQYMKGNIVRWCLCPHTDLQKYLKDTNHVWPEGLEAISKKIDWTVHGYPEVFPKPGYPFIIHHVGSISSLSKITVRCTKIELKPPQITNHLSNFPILYQILGEICDATRTSSESCKVIDTYDGNMELICKRNNRHHQGMSYTRWFRKDRKEYHMMRAHMTGDTVHYRLVDCFDPTEDSTVVLEVRDMSELEYIASRDDSGRFTVICQVHIGSLLWLVKWVASWCHMPGIRVVRFNEDYCYVILTHIKFDKVTQCIDPSGSDIVLEELRQAVAHNQSRLYDTWKIASSTSAKGTTEDELSTVLFGSHIHTKEGVITCYLRILHRCRYLKRKGMLDRMDSILYRYTLILAEITKQDDIRTIAEEFILDIKPPTTILPRVDSTGTKMRRSALCANDCLVTAQERNHVVMLDELSVNGDNIALVGVLSDKRTKCKKRKKETSVSDSD